MKKAIFKFGLAGMAIIGFTAMKDIAPANITGKVTPADAAAGVWAIKETDTITGAVSSEGTFSLEVKPGTWKVIVTAKSPYKNTEVGPVEATEDKVTDVGEIKLEQ